jgi:hypothetical protein
LPNRSLAPEIAMTRRDRRHGDGRRDAYGDDPPVTPGPSHRRLQGGADRAQSRGNAYAQPIVVVLVVDEDPSGL